MIKMLRHAGGDSVVSKLVEAGTGHSPQAELENPGGESRAEAQLGPEVTVKHWRGTYDLKEKKIAGAVT